MKPTNFQTDLELRYRSSVKNNLDDNFIQRKLLYFYFSDMNLFIETESYTEEDFHKTNAKIAEVTNVQDH